jgi:hypothetical protein
MDIATNPAAPSPEHLAQLDAARVASKKIRRVIFVANFDGWGIAAFAAITLAFSLTTPSGIILGLGMGYIAYRELSGAAALKRLEPAACRRLAINQLIFSGLLILYFAWCLIDSLTTPTDPEILESGFLTAAQAHVAYAAFYATLMFASILFQGGTAWYYAWRAKAIEKYLTATPQWIIDYQRGGGTL